MNSAGAKTLALPSSRVHTTLPTLRLRSTRLPRLPFPPKRPGAHVWGYSAQDRGLIEPGDVEEGLGAAAAVGDDALGNGRQESWTHGSSESRQRWFEIGFESGDPAACDTFSASTGQL